LHNFKVGDLIHKLPKHKRKRKANPIEIIKFYEYAYGKEAKIEKMVEIKLKDQTLYISEESLKDYHKF